MMLSLKTVGEAITMGIQASLIKCEKLFLKRNHHRNIKTKIFISILILMLMSICASTILTMYTDGYSFVHGCYLWFVTFSTIGFGDYIPLSVMEEEIVLQHGRGQNKLIIIGALSMIPSVVGICVVAAFLNSLIDLMKSFRKRVIRRNLRHSYDVQDTEVSTSTTEMHARYSRRLSIRKRTNSI